MAQWYKQASEQASKQKTPTTKQKKSGKTKWYPLSESFSTYAEGNLIGCLYKLSSSNISAG